MLSQSKLKQGKKLFLKISKDINSHSDWCSVMSDPTRIKILLAIRKYQDLYVSDIARLLGMSISAVSHQLSGLEKTGVVSRKKTGQAVCYRIKVKSKFFLDCIDAKGKAIKK
ncbi:MAG: transcriptional regulator [Candidatus Kerfeldbacteria bacterium CG_4_10_14_0_8_um_filter_42_10]|uniref:Transcriptional regulator n=1 Tax=Candidatus Kerfeldbacteria bacterium CG_4_10_14_0_8_um_filter_42_10 TaxID=2014248 RepID=A0A2M7RIR0_9BACT|nr:MAG: transcriptional regulator [Candidatus Kerfeldbacteria bacterium CG_4_10_14_0_8_um_filter_42_10]